MYETLVIKDQFLRNSFINRTPDNSGIVNPRISRGAIIYYYRDLKGVFGGISLNIERIFEGAYNKKGG